jgi:SAM-dependent methyltransferase
VGGAISQVIDLHQHRITWDEIRVESCGLVRLQGWSFLDSALILEPSLVLNGERVPLLNRWRQWRKDLRSHPFYASSPWPGFGFEWLLPGGDISKLVLEIAGAQPITIHQNMEISRPDHDFLFTHRQVLNRDQIYGSGLPCLTVDENIKALFPFIIGRILDFGCGAGALVCALREKGREAFGIEIDRPTITEHVVQEAAPFLTFYAGGSLPFENDAFDCVTAFEVIEHVTEHALALREISRVGRRLVMSVPDMAAIPILQRHNVVPWHLLESTHLNFFTETSLRSALAPHFSKVEIGRMGEIETNGSRYFISLLAVCDR